MACDCGRVPESFPDPIPRWTVLPGDPPALRRWLQAKQAADDGPPAEATEPWPDEESA